MSKKRVLITGAAGRIGKACARDLRERYDLRLMYHRTPLEEDFGQEVVQGAAGDLARMEEIVAHLDAFALDALPEKEERLFLLTLSLVEVSNLVERYKRREAIIAVSPLDYSSVQ